jgi:putative lipoprotein
VLFVFLVLASTAPAQSSDPMITGTISYMARMALPPDAAVDVRLEDVSLADAPSKLVAENIFALGDKQVPVPFQLPYNATDIQPSHRYSVRANITVNGNRLFTTTDSYPVLTSGAGSEVALTLYPIRQAASQPSGAPNALRGTKWMLTELHGKPVAPATNNPAFILLDPGHNQYSGSSGCNRVTGKFQLSGDSLQLLGGAMTMMACPEPLMTQEKEFNEALTATGSYQIVGNTLELMEGKKVVAKFTAGK